MIQSLRRAHLRIWIALALVLPVLLAAGLILRHAPEPNQTEVLQEISR